MRMSLSVRARVALATCCPAVVACVVLACSSSEPPASAAAGQCTQPTLTVLFTPAMYSAFDGVHSFQVPAVVDGIRTTASVTWSLQDPTIADITKDPSTGGVLLNIKKAGTTTLVASVGGLCGSSTLQVSAAAADDWEVGNQRYNNGIVLRPPAGPPPGADGGARPDGGPARDVACTNCHGPTANTAFKDIAHTPQQTGGFSDEQLGNIFRNGVVPDGGYFDNSIIQYAQWQRIHRWDMTDGQAKGIIVYLRGLTPAAQGGSSNFGGRFPDGGRPPPGPPGG